MRNDLHNTGVLRNFVLISAHFTRITKLVSRLQCSDANRISVFQIFTCFLFGLFFPTPFTCYVELWSFWIVCVYMSECPWSVFCSSSPGSGSALGFQQLWVKFLEFLHTIAKVWGTKQNAKKFLIMLGIVTRLGSLSYKKRTPHCVTSNAGKLNGEGKKTFS